MVASIAVSWFVGLIFLFILLLYTQDIQSIEQTQFEMPIAQLFLVRISNKVQSPLSLNELFPVFRMQ